MSSNEIADSLKDGQIRSCPHCHKDMKELVLFFEQRTIPPGYYYSDKIGDYQYHSKSSKTKRVYRCPHCGTDISNIADQIKDRLSKKRKSTIMSVRTIEKKKEKKYKKKNGGPAIF